MKNSEKAVKAFQLLETVPVSGPHVDTVHGIRQLLADLYRTLKKEEQEAEKK